VSIAFPARPTLHDVALRAGVSRAAAGFALQGLAKISPETRARVTAAAKALGYVPNTAAALLARSRHDPARAGARAAVALLHDRKEPSAYLHGATHHLQVIGQTAQELGLVLHIEAIGPRGADAAVFRRLRAKGVGGLLIHQSPEIAERVRAVPEDFAVVALDHSPGRPQAGRVRVSPDFHALVVMAWRRAKERGYTRPGFAMFAHAPRSEDDERLHAAAALCLAEVPPSKRVPVLACPHADEAAVVAWRRRHRPDVIIACHDGVEWWLRDAGYPSPEAQAMITIFRRQDEGRKEPVSGYLTDYVGMARQAFLLLTQAMVRADRSAGAHALSCTLPAQWHEGATAPRRV
jgi:DNA-binding LacI/PurR family transcriptional regulator